MTTNRNFFSKLSKASLIVTLAFTTLISVSCQNAARQSFHYKTDFIKQMVYQVSNDFLTRTGFVAKNSTSNNETAAILVNYTLASGKSVKHSSTNDAELACFLTEAAKLNTTVEQDEVADNTLDFLTEAAQLNTPVAEMETRNDNTLEFLSAAAQLNTEVVQENNSDDTLDLFINAAGFNTPVASEETSQDNLLDFLTQAAIQNVSVVE